MYLVRQVCDKNRDTPRAKLKYAGEQINICSEISDGLFLNCFMSKQSYSEVRAALI
jgi:hypothetical protein